MIDIEQALTIVIAPKSATIFMILSLGERGSGLIGFVEQPIGIGTG